MHALSRSRCAALSTDRWNEGNGFFAVHVASLSFMFEYDVADRARIVAANEVEKKMRPRKITQRHPRMRFVIVLYGPWILNARLFSSRSIAFLPKL